MDLTYKKQIVKQIREEADSYLTQKPNKYNMKDLEYRSYWNWALDELLREIEVDDDIPVDTVIEYFANKMETYACKDHPKSFIFSIAYDVSFWVLDIWISLGKEGSNGKDCRH